MRFGGRMVIDREKKNKLLKAGFAVYALLMLWLLFGQRLGYSKDGEYSEMLLANINLVPFHTVGLFVRSLLRSENPALLRHAVINLAGNVVMFVPLGFFIPAVFVRMRTFAKTVLCSAAVVTVVEIIQLFTLLGSCDIDDLILNMLGVAVGFIIFKNVKPIDFFMK